MLVTYRTYEDPDGGWWLEIKDGMSSGTYASREEAIADLPKLVERGREYEEHDRRFKAAIAAAEWMDDPAFD